MRLITFQKSFYDHVSHLYSDLNLLKLRDQVSLNNVLFIHDYLNNKLPSSFDGYFTLARDMYAHNTRNGSSGQLFVPDSDSVHYGRDSIKLKSILTWNYLTINIPGDDFLLLPRHKFKKTIVNYYLKNYALINTNH